MGSCLSYNITNDVDSSISKAEKLYKTKLDNAVALSQKRYGCTNWDAILRYNGFTETDLERYKDIIDWDGVCRYQRLSRGFIVKYCNRVDFSALSKNPNLTGDIIEAFIDEFSIYDVCKAIKAHKLSNRFVLELVASGERSYIASEVLKHYHLTQDAIDTIKFESYDVGIINALSQYQCLSEEFIHTHEDILKWDLISQYQTLSEAFVDQHKDKINWSKLSYNKSIHPDVAKKYRNQLMQTEEVETALFKVYLLQPLKQKQL